MFYPPASIVHTCQENGVVFISACARLELEQRILQQTRYLFSYKTNRHQIGSRHYDTRITREKY